MELIKLECTLRPEEIFRCLGEPGNKKHLFFMDSGEGFEAGEYSFMGYDPFLIFRSKGDEVTLTEFGQTGIFRQNQLEALREVLRRFKGPESLPFPFTGGGVGFFSYDLGRSIERLPALAEDDLGMPDIFLAFYEVVLVYCHKSREYHLCSNEITPGGRRKARETAALIGTFESRNDSLPRGKRIPPRVGGDEEFKANLSKEYYRRALDKIHSYIEEGDIYQVNFTRRLEAPLPEPPHSLYLRLRALNPAPFAGYLDFGEGVMVSSSPERFLRLKEGILETRPIKGTVPRGATKQEDAENRAYLEACEKNRSELLMIVDLERNDLGRVSEAGSVEVTELFKVEEYATVYHLVSTVRGKIRSGLDLVDCLKSAFPGGSITGAPKIRAMEIVEELEPTRRNLYTGSFGYVGFNGDFDLNIIIRTMLCAGQKVYFQTGGGIIWESDTQQEYEETLHKGRALMEALKMEKGRG